MARFRDTVKAWKQTVRQTQIDEAAFGQSDFGRELTAMELDAGDIQRDGRPSPAQEYITQMIELLRNAESSVANLKAVTPLIDEMAMLGGKDPLLTKPEKDKVAAAARKLKSFVLKHITVLSKTKKSPLITKERRAELRAKTADHLQESGSDALRVVGHLLGRKWRKDKPQEDNSAFERAAVTARAAIWKKADTNLQQAQDELNEPGAGARGPARGRSKIRKAPAPAFTESGLRGVGGGSDALLNVNQEILTNVKRIVDLMVAERQDDQEAEWAADNKSEDPVSFARKVGAAVVPDGKTKKGKLEILDALLGGSGVLKYAKALIPGLKILGIGAAVVGAAFVGWEIGKMIDKWTGASDYVQGAAEWFGRKLGLGGFGDADKEAKEQARLEKYHRDRAAAEQRRKEEKIDWATRMELARQRNAERKAERGDESPLVLGQGTPLDAEQESQINALAIGSSIPAEYGREIDVRPSSPVRMPSGFDAGGSVVGGADIARPTPPFGFDAGGSVAGGTEVRDTAPRRSPTPRAPARSSPRKLDRAALIKQIAKGEGKTDYNTTLGNGVFRPGGIAEEKTKPITNMTMREIYKLQGELIQRSKGKLEGVAANKGSSAVGKFQIIRPTLFGNGTPDKPQGLAGKLGLGPDDKFTPEVQNKLGELLLNNSGAGLYEAGKISAAEFQKRVAGTWASVAEDSNNRSAYGQPVGTTHAQFQAVLASGTPAPARSVNALNVPGASGASSGTAIVNAPSTTLVNNVQNGGTHTVVVPMNTRNPDVSLAAAQMRNVPMGG